MSDAASGRDRDAPGGVHGSVARSGDDVRVTSTTERPRTPARAGSSSFIAGTLGGAPRWVNGALTAVQGALLSLLVVVLPAVAAYVATSADPANEGVEWFRAVAVGTALWLAGHGVPPSVGGVAVTVVPLGVTALTVFTCWASARRSGLPTRSSYVAAVVTYTAVVVVLTALVAPGVLAIGRAALGGAATGALGLGLGLAARPGGRRAGDVLQPYARRVPTAVAAGLRAGTAAFSALMVAAALVVVGWTLVGRSTVWAIADGLGVDALGGAVLAVAQLAFLPVLVAWALAWVAGPGFVVGEGTHFANDAMTGGTLPAVPLLGALPGADVAGGPSVLAPLLVVLAGAVAGWYVHRAFRAAPLARAWTSAAACAVAAACSGVLAALVVQAASGAIGPGRMATTGAPALTVGAVVAAEVLLGALLVALPADRRLRVAVVRGVLRRPGAGS